jgi:hypothetical protein
METGEMAVDEKTIQEFFRASNGGDFERPREHLHPEVSVTTRGPKASTAGRVI